MKTAAIQNKKTRACSDATLPMVDEETGGATGALAIQQPPPALLRPPAHSDTPSQGISGFMPVIFLKAGCPYCFKLRLALLEAGLSDRVRFQEFEADTPEESLIRTQLSRHFFALSFPAAEIAPGQFEKGSDALIQHFLEHSGKTGTQLVTLQAYIEGPFAQLTDMSTVTRSTAAGENTSTDRRLMEGENRS